jgi:hypothetical protein
MKGKDPLLHRSKGIVIPGSVPRAAFHSAPRFKDRNAPEPSLDRFTVEYRAA